MNEKGFTLIELIAVMIILGLLAAFVVPRYLNLDKTAQKIAAKAAITELNILELQAWTVQKFDGNVEDREILVKVATSISESCYFKHYYPTGGYLLCGRTEVKLERIQATNSGPGKWK